MRGTPSIARDPDLTALHEALLALEQLDPRKAAEVLKSASITVSRN
jgi:hypothetical protein